MEVTHRSYNNLQSIDLQVNSYRAKEGFFGRNPFEKGFLPNHLPKTFNILR